MKAFNKSSKFRLFKYLILAILTLLLGVQLSAQENSEATETDPSLWQYDVVYARAAFDAPRVFSAPNFDSQFTPMFEMYRGALLALVAVDGQPGWYWVPPNNGIYNPWRHWNRVYDVYVNLEDFVIMDDFAPATIYPDSLGVDRQVIAIRSTQPELLLVEQGQIILRVPVGMGWDQSIPRDVHTPQDSPTPLGEFAIAKISPSRHMSIYPGVPFVMYYSGGMALHEAYWIAWNDTYRGNFWTGGCMNVPDYSRWNVSWEGTEISVEHFIFKWGMSNFQLAGYDPYVHELFSMDWNSDAYRTKNGTLRVLIVPDIQGLYNYLTPSQYPEIQGSLQSWDGIIEQYNHMVNNRLWRLPHSENGVASFIEISYHDMAEREPR